MQKSSPREYKDEGTGKTIYQLTSGEVEVRHTYYDMSPWSPDDSKIVFAAAKPGAEYGSVYIMDNNGDNIKLVADDATFSAHHGARTFWGTDGTKVYYQSKSGNTTDEGYSIQMVDVNTLEKREIVNSKLGNLSYTGGLMLSPDGRNIAFNGKDRNEEWGIYIVGADGKNLKKIVSLEEVRALSPSPEELKGTESFLMHAKWNPDSESLFFVHSNELDVKPPTVKELYYITVDGSEVSFIADFGHHPTWHPDGEHIIFYDWLNEMYKDQRLFIVNKNGNDRRILIDKQDGGIHASYNPQGTMIITDAYYKEGIFLLTPQTNSMKKIATVKIQNHSHSGTHMHPAWNRAGNKILYQSDQTGHGHLYLVEINDK
ncbi:MAG: hypothetical protein ACOCWM_03345 [Cyclobacteriaceae bacterium]